MFLPKTQGDQREPLPPDYTAKLLDIAISLHDREATRRQQRTTFSATFIHIGVAIIAGLFSIAVVLLEIAHPAAK